MKYSWKQRRWRTGGTTGAVRLLEALPAPAVQVMQAIDGRRRARDKQTDGFHMLSLAATSASASWWRLAIMSSGGGAVTSRAVVPAILDPHV
jgi:hypothetical protein